MLHLLYNVDRVTVFGSMIRSSIYRSAVSIVECVKSNAYSHLSAIIGSLIKLLLKLSLNESVAPDSVCSSQETCEYLANSAMAS